MSNSNDLLHHDIQKFRTAWKNRIYFPDITASVVIYSHHPEISIYRKILSSPGLLNACMDIIKFEMYDILNRSTHKEINFHEELRKRIIKTGDKEAAFGFLTTIQFYDDNHEYYQPSIYIEPTNETTIVYD